MSEEDVIEDEVLDEISKGKGVRIGGEKISIATLILEFIIIAAIFFVMVFATVSLFYPEPTFVHYVSHTIPLIMFIVLMISFAAAAS